MDMSAEVEMNEVELPSPQPLLPHWRRVHGDVIRMAVIGGSTPFASRLFGAMANGLGTDDGADVTWDLRLLGRDDAALAVMAAHARAVLDEPHRVTAATDVGQVLDGCDVVIVQPRIGGLAERAADEDLGEAVGAPADEGLGPGGARAAIRSAPALRALAVDLQAHCPDAFVIAFTNPLSVTVSVLHAAGAASAGVCELPLVTAYEIADRLGVDRHRLSWQFTGLSHRGFIHDVEVDGESRLNALVDVLRADDASVGGIGADVIAAFDAVPLKYHAMLSGASRPASGRARALQSIRDEALVQLAREPARRRRFSLNARCPGTTRQCCRSWRRSQGDPCAQIPPHVLDLMCDDGLVHELVADLTPGAVTARPLTSSGEPRGSQVASAVLRARAPDDALPQRADARWADRHACGRPGDPRLSGRRCDRGARVRRRSARRQPSRSALAAGIVGHLCHGPLE